MRHRISEITGLGNPSECLLPNTWSNSHKFNEVTKLFLKECLSLQPIRDFGGLDFKVSKSKDNFTIDFGFEPAYQHDELLIYHIEKDINKYVIQKGIAKGAYGSDIEITETLKYADIDDEFKELINKWHSKLVESCDTK